MDEQPVQEMEALTEAAMFGLHSICHRVSVDNPDHAEVKLVLSRSRLRECLRPSSGVDQDDLENTLGRVVVEKLTARVAPCVDLSDDEEDAEDELGEYGNLDEDRFVSMRFNPQYELQHVINLPEPIIPGSLSILTSHGLLSADPDGVITSMNATAGLHLCGEIDYATGCINLFLPVLPTHGSFFVIRYVKAESGESDEVVNPALDPQRN